MCGICCILQLETVGIGQYYEQVIQLIKKRGSDYVGRHSLIIGNNHKLQFHGCVLHMRGDTLFHQPAVDIQGNTLLWNGEIFGGLEVKTSESDTQVLLKQLLERKDEAIAGHIIAKMSKIQGPFAFVYYQASDNQLWFGRDIFGRRSLLIHFPTDSTDCFALSSVVPKSPKHDWREVPATGLFCMHLNAITDLANDIFSRLDGFVQFYPWRIPYKNCLVDIQVGFASQGDNVCSKDSTERQWFSVNNSLNSFVTRNLSPFNRSLPPDKFTLTENDYGVTVERFFRVLSESVRKRVSVIYPSSSIAQQSCCEASMAGVGVLFSGGIDSAIIAALTDRHVPLDEPIDLINVAFADSDDPSSEHFKVPDRISGREILKELHSLNADRHWNFIEVNVSLSEVRQIRKSRMRNLVYPHATVLDDSLGCAMWFAARGQGFKLDFNQRTLKPYCSTAKVWARMSNLVVMQGIGRNLCMVLMHHLARNLSVLPIPYLFIAIYDRRQGWNGLLSEIEMEIVRISERNLGRDDRCISDHAREAVFPYLDEDVVSFLNSLPIHLKMDMRLAKGVGDKILLRKVGQYLGLRNASSLIKKAIQFGSRIAKLETTIEKGSDQCLRLA